MTMRLLAVVAACAALSATGAAQSQAGAAQLERGKYLVENVGLCADCHSAHDAKGELIREQYLGGAPVPFKPTVPMPWAAVAPPLAGLQYFQENEVVTLLTTGQMPDGTRPRAPMPPYHLTHDDAMAVVAYLKTLKPVVSTALKDKMKQPAGTARPEQR